MKHDKIEPPKRRKFSDPETTADGSGRASVALTKPTTLWFNTGTLCNIACKNCYIESSPRNDQLAYLSTAEVRKFICQATERNWPLREIGFTGGEPFLNPDIIEMLEASLDAGFEVLVLTNAMQPMMRPRVREALARLQQKFSHKLTLRVSLDHWTPAIHDLERGKGAFRHTLSGLKWLSETGIRTTVAGRLAYHDTEENARAGFANFFDKNGLGINPNDPSELVLFPEMDEQADVPEITTACWDILGKSPDQIMCATSRMVVKRRNAEHPVVLACTLIAYDPEFELGTSLADAERDVFLNHPHCAKFCVLGGASCSV